MKRSALGSRPLSIEPLETRLLMTAAPLGGTFVRVNTSMGVIPIQLFDSVAPRTVENFLNYVTDEDYKNTIFHRSSPGFVVQTGGFTRDFEEIPDDARILNEFGVSNTRGTIAMAKVGDNPNSATSQWFVNLANNSANLDAQNGGFTVFGRVLGDGMDVVDAIAALPRYRFNQPFDELPLKDFTPSQSTPEYKNLVIVYSTTELAPPWQRAGNPQDVDGNGRVNAQDILVIQNKLARDGRMQVPFPTASSTPPTVRYDVDGDNTVSRTDATSLLRFVNPRPTARSAEFASGDLSAPATSDAKQSSKLARSFSINSTEQSNSTVTQFSTLDRLNQSDGGSELQVESTLNASITLFAVDEFEQNVTARNERLLSDDTKRPMVSEVLWEEVQLGGSLGYFARTL